MPMPLWKEQGQDGKSRSRQTEAQVGAVAHARFARQGHGPTASARRRLRRGAARRAAHLQ